MEVVFDVHEQDFEEKVVRASYESVVVVDFWADWCMPCKMLGPVLENVVREFDGGVLLAKLDVDENGELAARFGIRSIPTVKIFKDGSVAEEFVGVMPEPQIRSLLRELAGGEKNDALEQASRLLDEGRLDEAGELFQSVLTANPGHSGALLGLARTALKREEYERAVDLLESIDETDGRYEEARRLLAGIEFVRVCRSAGGLENFLKNMSGGGEDLEAEYILGCCYAAHERYPEALDTFLDILKKDTSFGDGKARNALIALFNIMGPESELTRTYRERMANILF